MVTVSIAALAFPLTRTVATGGGRTSTPVLTVADGLTATLYAHAQTVTSALTQAAPTPTSQSRTAYQALDGVPAGGLVPRPLLAAAASLLVQGALAGPDGQRGIVVQLQRPVRFTLNEGGLASDVFSTRPTVGAALSALGVDYSAYDRIVPAPETPLTAGLHVFVRRAASITLEVGGDDAVTVYTHAETVAGVLAENGVELSKDDRVSPGTSVRVRDGLVISVTVVNKVIEYEDTPIAYRTVYRDDSSMLQGEYKLVQGGAAGYVRREYSVVYENGEEVIRDLVSETVVAPTHRIVAQGTSVVAAAVAPPTAPAGDPQCARTLSVWATWYTAASAGGSGITATGTSVRKGTVAVDPRVIPLGTSMYVPGYGYGVAEDTGGGVIGNFIDLGYGPDDVKDWSSRWVEICIL